MKFPPPHRNSAERYLLRAHEAASTDSAGATAFASLATAHAVLAVLDALESVPRSADIVRTTMRDLSADLDRSGVTPGLDDQEEPVIAGADSAREAINGPSSVSLDGQTGRSQIRATLISRLIEVLNGRHDVNVIIVPELAAGASLLGTTSVIAFADDIADALVEDGWRPPLPDGGQDSGGDVPAKVLEPASLEAVRRIQRECEVLSGLPGYSEGEQRAEIEARMDRGELVQVGETWYERIDFTETPTVSPRVFLPGDVVPAGLWVSYRTPKGLAAAMGAEDWMAMDGAVVELDLPSLADWQDTVDRASADRREREQAHLDVLKADLGADIAREHGVLPDEDEDPEKSTSDTEHADDCQGCDGPGIVPCAADRVIGNTAYRNGQPIKDLEAGRG